MGNAFLPSGDMLVAERSGTLNIITQEGQKTPIQGTPEVVAKSQGGLLDVNIDPDYADNGWVYISYSEKDPKGVMAIAPPLCEVKLTEINGLKVRLFSISEK